MALANATTPKQRAFHEWRAMVVAAHRKRVFLHPPWRAKFENFLADMGEPPPGKKLWRWQEDRGFIPQNCHWA